MKLYEVPNNSLIKIMDAGPALKGRVFHFHHIDGAYSLCTDEDDRTIHLSASVEVEVITKDKS